MDKNELMDELNREDHIGFSVDEIRLTVAPDEDAEGTLVFHAGSDDAEGYVIVNDTRMNCESDRFHGNVIRLAYRFDGRGLENGEVYRGEFCAVTTCGEFILPFTVTVSQEAYETSIGNIKNLFHFANLAKTNWEEAVRFFYSGHFQDLLVGNDHQYLNIYRGLFAGTRSEQRIEEFLIAIKKKRPVEFIVTPEEIELTALSDIGNEKLVIARNGWGYTNLTVSMDGDFLVSEKERLTDDDFLGNSCELKFSVLQHKLHAGCNFGRIVLENEYVRHEVPVRVTLPNVGYTKQKRTKKRENVRMIREYVRFALKQISRQDWLADAKASLAQTSAVGVEKPIRDRLFEVVLLIAEKRMNEAKWVLERIDRSTVYNSEKTEIWCYYLYLTILCADKKEQAMQAAEEVERIYNNNPDNWKIGCLMLFVGGEYDRSPTKKWLFLEELFLRGCNSPILYLEAALLLRDNPSVLTKPTPFAIYAMNFMVKYNCVTDDIAERIYYLAGRLREFSPRMEAILRACYLSRGDKDALSALCTMLIKGEKVGPQYLIWYREAILQEIWLTRVYENYLLSIDYDTPEEIPDAALRYFAYHTDLPYDRVAYLYAYVVRGKERHAELYRAYMADIEQFVETQLSLGHINEDLSYLYQKVIRATFLTGPKADIFAGLLATHEILIADERVKSVVVVYGKLKTEKEFPVVNGTCYAEIFSKDMELFFLLQGGARLHESVPYKMRKLILFHEDLEDISPQISGTDEQLLNICENGKNYTVITGDTLQFARLLLESEDLMDEYRTELAMKILRFYQDHDMMRELDDFIPLLDPTAMTSRERADAIEIMVSRGKYEQAFSWIRDYGLENIAPKILVRIASRMLVRIDFVENPILTGIIRRAFERGKYDDHVLYYMNRYYRGSVMQMTDVWEACERFEVDDYELSERLLTTMKFCSHYSPPEKEIFLRYVSGGAKESVVHDYLQHCGREFIKGKASWDERIAKEISRMYNLGEEVPVVCILCTLKLLADRSEYNDEEKVMIRHFLHIMMQKNQLFFDYFRHYADICPEVMVYHDRSVVEFIFQSDNPVVFHHMIGKEGDENGKYQMEELTDNGLGVVTREFVLFFGETLHYYFSELVGGKEKFLTSGQISKSDTDRLNAGSRYNLTNQIAMAVEIGNYEMAETLYEEYCRKDFLTEKLFHFE
ncbi:MAG: hypothetical protein E7300_03840 [Lachnospiraceae bacterium]|nr:hypothetical protein [Lachnospiraceae bacterium]